MTEIREFVDLQSYNSFGIRAVARYFCDVHSVDELRDLILSPLYKATPHLILGGGSNILLTGDFNGLVVKIGIKGIEVENESDHWVDLRVGAGEDWHQLVMYCVDRGWGGIENLSLIPGTVGAAPIQNIGAYGVEVAEVIRRVDGVDAVTGDPVSFNRDQCRFGYRESAFKNELKEKIFISSVTLTLAKKDHRLRTDYGALTEMMKSVSSADINVRSVSDAVIYIRRSKLPDHTVIGNAGSFFKNPTLAVEAFTEIQRAYQNIPSYPVDNQNVKVPAAWLIEQSGWKGKRINHVGVHPQQALVLVNYGGGTGEEILSLAKQIQASVKQKFRVELIPEVNII